MRILPRPTRTQETAGTEIDHRRWGRRRGDAILIAFNHALDQGDIEVASQLIIEYQKINADLPLTLSVDRRKRPEETATAVSRMWERLRRAFTT